MIGAGLPSDNCAPKDGYDPRRPTRNGVSNSSHSGLPIYSYPRRTCEKDEKRELMNIDGVVQPKTQFAGVGIGRKIAAASNGAGQAY